jgi:NADH-quinone oxidoreductase subunit K
MITEALVLSAILFAIGTFGVLVRRNAIIMFLCIELQLNAVNLALRGLLPARGHRGAGLRLLRDDRGGRRGGGGLAIIISIFRHYETVNVDNFNLLKW